MSDGKTEGATAAHLAGAYSEIAAAQLLQRASALLSAHYGSEWKGAWSHSDELQTVAASQAALTASQHSNQGVADPAEMNEARLLRDVGEVSSSSSSSVDSYLRHLLPTASTPHSWLTHWRLAQYLSDVGCDQVNAGKQWRLAQQTAPAQALALLRRPLESAPESKAPASSTAERSADSASKPMVHGLRPRRPSQVANAPMLGAVCLFWAQFADWKASHAHAAEEAEQMLRQVLEVDPRHVAAVGTLALLTHRGIGNVKEAARLYAMSSNLFDDHSSMLTKHANFLKITGLGKLDAVRRLYDRSLRHDPENPDTLGALAVLLHGTAAQSISGEADQLNEAEIMYQRALTACTWHTNNLGNYGLFLTDVRHAHSEAEALYRRALETDPHHANTLYNYAVLCDTKTLDKPSATALYVAALESKPRHPFAHYNLAVLLEEGKSDFARAKRHYAAAAECEPSDVGIVTDFATFLWRKVGDAPAATKAFARALHTLARRLQCAQVDVPPASLSFAAEAHAAYPQSIPEGGHSTVSEEAAKRQLKQEADERDAAAASDTLQNIRKFKAHASLCAAAIADVLGLTAPAASELPATLGLGPGGGGGPTAGGGASRPSTPRANADANAAAARRLAEEERAESVYPGSVKLLHRWIVFEAQVAGSSSADGSPGKRHTIVKRKGPARTGHSTSPTP